MKVTINCIAFTSVEIPEDLVRAFDPSTPFAEAWCRNLAHEVNCFSIEKFDVNVEDSDVYEALTGAKDGLEQEEEHG